MKAQMQDDDDRRNAARTHRKACSRRFLCAVDELSRKIVINAPVSAVGFFVKGYEMEVKICPDCKRNHDSCVCDYRLRQQEEIEDLRRRLAAIYDRATERMPRLCKDCAHSSLEGDRSLLCHHKMVEADDPLVLSGISDHTFAMDERSKRKESACGINGKLWEAK